MSLPSVACFRQMDIIDQLTALYEAILQISGGSFSPDQILGLRAWYRDTGIQHAESTVTGWNDESGNELNLSVGEFNPAFQAANLNGLDTIFIDTGDGNSGTVLSRGSALFSGTSATLFIVAQKSSEFPDSGWYTVLTDDPNIHPNNSGDIHDAFCSTVNKNCGTQIVEINNNWRILSIRSRDGEYRMEVDGEDQFSTNTNTFSTGTNFILGSGSDNANAFKGSVAEVIAYNAFLTDNQVMAVMTYLRNRFNL